MKAHRHNYMMLSRYKQDLDYYWGHGNQASKHLYFGDYDTHMAETIKLWKSLPEKPEWFTAAELIEYKNRRTSTC